MRLTDFSNHFKMETGKEIHCAFVCGRSVTSEIIKKILPQHHLDSEPNSKLVLPTELINQISP